jgi:hypothetical protein
MKEKNTLFKLEDKIRENIEKENKKCPLGIQI